MSSFEEQVLNGTYNKKKKKGEQSFEEQVLNGTYQTPKKPTISKKEINNSATSIAKSTLNDIQSSFNTISSTKEDSFAENAMNRLKQKSNRVKELERQMPLIQKNIQKSTDNNEKWNLIQNYLKLQKEHNKLTDKPLDEKIKNIGGSLLRDTYNKTQHFVPFLPKVQVKKKGDVDFDKTTWNALIETGKGVVDFSEGVMDSMFQFGSSEDNPFMHIFNSDKNLEQKVKGAGGAMLRSSYNVYKSITPSFFPRITVTDKSDESIKARQDIAKEIIEKDASQEWIDKRYNKKLANGKTIQETLDENSLVKSDNFAGQLFRSTGRQLPSIVLTGSAPTERFGGNTALALMGVDSYGSGVEEAYKNGATRRQANAYGALNAGIEMGTEKMTGGVKFFGKGSLDTIANKGIDKVKNPLARSLLHGTYDVVGEGGEEVVSAYLNPYAKKITYAKDKSINELKKEEGSLLQNFLMGAGGALLMKGLEAPANISMKNNIQNQQNQQNLPINEQNNTQINEKTTNLQDLLEKSINDAQTEQTLQNEPLNKQIAPVRTDINQENVVNENTTTQNETQLLERLKEIREQTTNKKEQAKLDNHIQQIENDIKNLSNTNETFAQDNKTVNKYQYTQSDNAKINDLRADAAKYFDNSQKTTNYINMLEKLITDKNVGIRLDANLTDEQGNFANGKYENGVITINPNSNRAGEFIAIHELTHAIGTDSMMKIVDNYRKSNAEFDNAVKELLGKKYNTNELTEEALADVSGQLFGNQEFINNLSQNNPGMFKKIYNEIKYLWHQFRGYKNQNQFIEDLQYKWEQTYRKNNKLNDNSNYYIENIASYDENEYNNIKQEKLTNREFANLATIINSDTQITPGKNIIENIYDYNTKKYKDYEIYYKDKGQFKIIKSKFSEGDSNARYSKSDDSGDATTRSRQTNNKLGNRVVENERTTTTNDELPNINQRETYSERKSNRYDRQNSRELENSSFSVEENNNLRNKAKEELGTTTNLNEAGYLTNDGEYLDFSGKKQGARGGQRQMDHREIADIYEDEQYDAAEKKYPNMGSNTAILQDFLDRGNIRLNGTGVEIATAPTQEQYSKLYDYLEHVQQDNGEVFIDLDTETKNRENLEYGSNTSINKMINDIKQHYNNSNNVETTAADNQGRTLSKEQQEYFKNSKVRDENGNLEVVYHGSKKAGFTTFKTSDNVSFFTDNEGVAETYSGAKEKVDTRKLQSLSDAKSWLKGINEELYIENNKVYNYDGEEILGYDNQEDLLKNLKRGIQTKIGNTEAGGIYEGYANIINPYILDVEGKNWNNITIGENTEVKKMYESLNAKEKDTLSDLADKMDDMYDKWNDSVEGFYQRLNATNEKLYDKVTSDNSIREKLYKAALYQWNDSSVEDLIGKRYNTNDIVKQVLEKNKNGSNYDGVIFKNIIDEGLFEGGTNNKTSTVYVTFNPNQFKAIDNTNPTSNEDIRYSKENKTWQEYLEKEFKAEGTTTNLKDIKLPTKEKTKLPIKEVAKKEVKQIAPVKEELKTDKKIQAQVKGELKEFNDYYDYAKEITKNNDELVKELLFKNYTFDYDIPINQNEKRFYHGTDAVYDYDSLKTMDFDEQTMDRNYGDYFYITPDKSFAHTYGNQIAQFIIPKNKIMSLESFNNSGLTEEEAFKNYWAIEMPDNEYIVANPQQIIDYSKNITKEYIEKKSSTKEKTKLPTKEVAKKEVKLPVKEKSTTKDNIPMVKSTDNVKQIKYSKPDYKKIADAINSSNTKTRSWLETSIDSKTLEEYKPELIKGLKDENLTYEVQSNKKTLEKANKKLSSMSYEDAVSYIDGKIYDEKNMDLTDIALTERLIQEASKKGDYQTASDLIQNLAILGTDMGQKVQALSLIRRLTPEGQLSMYQKIVKRAKARGEYSFDNVEITPEMVEKVLSVYNEDGTYDQNELNEKVEEFKQDIAEQMKSTVGEKIDSWRYLSMLGNPKTHIRNIVSNVAMRGTIKVKNAMARTLETVLPIKQENRTKTFKRPSNDVKQYAKQTALEMKDIIRGEAKYNEKTQLEAKKKIFKNRVLEGASNFNSNALEAEDWFFSRRAFQDTFEEYLTAQGIKTKQDIENNPKIIEKARQYSVEQAEIATFRQYSKLASMINQFERKSKAGKVAVEALVPFKKTPINVAKAGVNYSPLGLIKDVTYNAYQLKEGNINGSQFVDNLSQGMTGTSLALLGYALAKAGILSGSGGNDKDDKYDKQLGNQGYAINLGGKSYSISWLSPTAMPMLVGANAYEQLEEGKEWDMNVVSDSLAKTLDPLNEMSFMSGLTNALNSYGSGTDKLKGSLESTAQNYVGQFFPTLFSQIASVTDDTKRSTQPSNNSKYKFGEQTLRSVMYKIPGLRQKLEPATDIWGNDKKQSDGILERAFESFISPYSKTEDKTTDLDRELKRVYSETGDTTVIPGIPYGYTRYQNETYRMSAKEYTKYKKKYGQAANNYLNELINTDSYQYASDEMKAKMIEKIYKYVRAEANEQYFKNTDVEYTSDELKELKELKNIGISNKSFSEYVADKTQISSIRSSSNYSTEEKRSKISDIFTSSNLNNKQLSYLYGKYYSTEEKLKALNSVDMPMKQFIKYDLQEFKSDYNSKGKSVRGSRQNKVMNYINNLNLSVPQKALLIKMEYNSFNSYNKQIENYINSSSGDFLDKAYLIKQSGFSGYDKQIINYVFNNYSTASEREDVLKNLGFTIRNGRVY